MSTATLPRKLQLLDFANPLYLRRLARAINDGRINGVYYQGSNVASLLGYYPRIRRAWCRPDGYLMIETERGHEFGGSNDPLDPAQFFDGYGRHITASRTVCGR
jgi:hypothetical protein